MKYRTFIGLLLCYVIVINVAIYYGTSNDLILIEGHYDANRLGRFWVPDRWWPRNEYYVRKIWPFTLIPLAIVHTWVLSKTQLIEWDPGYTGDNLRRYMERREELKLQKKK